MAADAPSSNRLIRESGLCPKPHWRRDGKELFYRRGSDGAIFSVEVNANAVFQTGASQRLTVLGIGWDVTADGKQFLTLMPQVQSGPPQFTVALNWQVGLKK